VPLQVLLVDDHPAVRHGVRRLIEAEGDAIMVAEAGSASEATSELARWADVAVIDYHLGGRDGLWLTRQIKQRPSPPPVLVYSAFADSVLAAAAVVAGADGLLGKRAIAEEVMIAIRRLFHGRRYFPAIPDSTIALLRSRLLSRDQAIFSMLVDGLVSEEIGSRLGISRAALDARRQVILRAIAPGRAGAGLPDPQHPPLDYDRPRRERHPTSG
jgi:DNA-binding NarL/FixJ family response regulator